MQAKAEGSPAEEQPVETADNKEPEPVDEPEPEPPAPMEAAEAAPAVAEPVVQPPEEPVAAAEPEPEAKPSPASKARKSTGRGRGKKASLEAAPAEEEPSPKTTKQPAGAPVVPVPEIAAPVPAVPVPGGLTLKDIHKDELMQIADERWSAAVLASGSIPPFDPALVSKIYNTELGGQGGLPSQRRVALLELSQYLENYLWPNFSGESSFDHIFSIVMLVNEKQKEGVAMWDCFQSRAEEFPAFFARVLALKDAKELQPYQRSAYLSFLLNAFRSLENEMVRGQVLKLVSLPLWHSLSRGRLQLELHEHAQLAKLWQKLAKKEAKAAQKVRELFFTTKHTIQQQTSIYIS